MSVNKMNKQTENLLILSLCEQRPARVDSKIPDTTQVV